MGASTVKYVIIADAGIEYPVVFSSILDHADVVKTPNDVVAAGICLRRQSGKWVCWGGGASLKTFSRGKIDEEILCEFLPG